MAKQTINIGAAANDGTGDPIRTAFGKVNDNFTEIYTANTGTNTGDQNLAAYATTAAVAAGYQPLDSDLTAIAALTTTAYGRALLSTADAPTLRTAIGLGQTDAPTFLAQTLTGQSLTGTQATSLVDLATTWLSTTGTPTAIKLNVTDTASNTNSLLMDLQVGGVSQCLARKTGIFSARSGYSAGPEVGFECYTLSDQAMSRTASRRSVMIGNYITGIRLSADYSISWGSGLAGTNDCFGGPDIFLARDAPGILAQRNGTAKQVHRVYNTFLGTTANEWGGFDWLTTANTLRIGTEHGGTGTARPIDFVVGGTARMSLSAASDLTVVGSVSTGSGFVFTSKGYIGMSSSGVMSLNNWIGNDFNRLQLGGTTSAFPAIKRNGATLEARLADDSAYASFNAQIITGTGYLISGATLWRTGTGSPEGVYTAPVGSIFSRTDGSAGTSFYVKESGTGNTGWVAK